jgi:hypothetical protein
MTQRETNDDERAGHIWQYGRKVANYKPSKANMSEVRKEIISRALRFDIRDVRTYAGYKGDLLVQITATDMLVLKALQKQAEILKMETVIREDRDLLVNELYCIVPDDVYVLKTKTQS